MILSNLISRVALEFVVCCIVVERCMDSEKEANKLARDPVKLLVSVRSDE